LSPLVDELKVVFSSKLDEYTYEIVLVNDDSPDDSWEEIVRLSKIHVEVYGVSLSRNFGQHNATMAGLREARGQYVVVMDDDLQHPPSAIPQILDRLRGGADVCYTVYHERKHAIWKKLGSRVNDIAANLLLGKPRGLYLSSFKGMKRFVADSILSYDGPFTYVDGLILGVTKRIDSVSIDHGTRYAGEGNYGLKKSISLWLKMATSFSVVPLRLASMMGMFLGLAAAATALYVGLSVWLYGSSYPGWASVIIAVLLVGSIQLLGLGLIGEYIGRAYLRLNNKPQFVVRVTTKDIHVQ
jgi:polyisoprenyl-phosphate glycosyltransferase